MRYFLPLIALMMTTASAPAMAGEKKPLLAAGLNWVLPGAGYIYNGEKPLYVSLPMIAGAGGLTYIENFHDFGGGQTLADVDSTAFMVMFGSVLILNTGVAIDAYREAKTINGSASLDTSGDADAGRTVRFSLSPAVLPGEEKAAYGLSLGARY